MLTIPLIQIGFGGVGRAVVERVLDARDEFEWRMGLEFEYVALCDSAGAVIDQNGLSPGTLRRLLEHKRQGRSLAESEVGYRHEGLLDIVDLAGSPEAIVIDVTASDDTVPALQLALDRGYAVVLANKKPLAGPIEVFREFTGSGRLRYEATVGAGVPVIATLQEALLASHDTVHHIEGCFSGTLGYLTTGLEQGVAFSQLVGQAHAMGYTEPDPRDDLGGMDVARKALILGRTLGWPLELEHVEVEPLYPAELGEGSVEDFMNAIETLDESYRQRVQAAREQGSVLRYVASLQGSEARVGLQTVPQDSPLGRLQGTDNLITFHTEVYNETPLVLQGRGAGVHGTAAGVVADIVALARCRK
ncbi:MAG: homoserine dehydrogenase [Caldilineae bacterium]|nr:MAG: homoserine dehydrogenase [Caldilineae bacterium]